MTNWNTTMERPMRSLSEEDFESLMAGEMEDWEAMNLFGRILRSGDGGAQMMALARQKLSEIPAEVVVALSERVKGLYDEVLGVFEKDIDAMAARKLVVSADLAESTLCAITAISMNLQDEKLAGKETELRRRAMEVRDLAEERLEEIDARVVEAGLDNDPWLTRIAELEPEEWYLQAIHSRGLMRHLEVPALTPRKDILSDIRDALVAAAAVVMVPLPTFLGESFAGPDEGPEPVELLHEFGDLRVMRMGGTIILRVPAGHELEGVSAEIERGEIVMSNRAPGRLYVMIPDIRQGGALRLQVRVDGEKMVLPVLKLERQ